MNDSRQNIIKRMLLLAEVRHIFINNHNLGLGIGIQVKHSVAKINTIFVCRCYIGRRAWSCDPKSKNG